MSIRIESLFPDYPNSFVAPPEAESFVLYADHSVPIPEPDISPEVASIYGGTSASIAVMPTSAGIISPSSTSDFSAAIANVPGNWSNALQTVLDRPPAKLPNQLLASSVLFCAAFATWAAVGQIDEVGRAQGRLIPQGETYKVNPVVSGKVANVYVQESQLVRAGQVIAKLDDAIARNLVEWSVQAHSNYEKERLQVEALIDKTRLEVQTQQAIANAAIQAQDAAIAQVRAKIESQKAAIWQAEDRAATSRLLLNQLQANAAVQQERLSRFEYLVNEGALAREQLFQAQQQLADRQRSMTQQLGDIQQSLSEAKRLRADLQQVFAEFNRLQAERTRKYAEAQEMQLQSQQKVQQLLVQKTQLQAKIQQNFKQFKQAKAELEQLTLKAPATGIISTLNIRKSGDVAQAGHAIAEIAPEGAPLVLAAALPTREAGFVKVGDPVQIKFDAYPYQDYGTLSGKVITISPDIKSDERLGAVYRVEIALERSSLTRDQQAIALKAGQTATAEIVTRRRRIAEVLLDPIRKLQETNLSL
ncbi:multidrug resistance efflux pump [Leptolyngbyaceae cyanobacterium JSC-12]|nr:multidrug resistance efflux pump [Leptolyngbyaceae cyanobacterium JSC-12]